MKKFIISLLFGFILISAGGVMLAVELSNYELIEVDDTFFKNVDYDEFEFDVSEYGMALEISEELEDYPIQYEYDDTMLGKVKIEIPSYMKYRMHSNTLIIDDMDYVNIGIEDFNEIKRIFDIILDGLKEDKIYVMKDYDKFFIKITCAKEERYKITIKQKYE